MASYLYMYGSASYYTPAPNEWSPAIAARQCQQYLIIMTHTVDYTPSLAARAVCVSKMMPHTVVQ
jgi:hypothetical protein